MRMHSVYTLAELPHPLAEFLRASRIGTTIAERLRITQVPTVCQMLQPCCQLIGAKPCLGFERIVSVLQRFQRFIASLEMVLHKKLLQDWSLFVSAWKRGE